MYVCVSSQVHVVTEEEAAAGTYTIEDVVLPIPGYRVQYPQHSTGDLYRTLCAQEIGVEIPYSGLTQPADHGNGAAQLAGPAKGSGQGGAAPQGSRKVPGWAAPFSFQSLSGDYRRLVLKPGHFSYK